MQPPKSIAGPPQDWLGSQVGRPEPEAPAANLPDPAPADAPATPSRHLSECKFLRRFAWLSALAWTLILAGSLYINIRQTFDNANELARHKALDSFNKDQAIRLWINSLGGVYLNTARGAQPLHCLASLPERDITLADGRTFTLYDSGSVLKDVQRTHGPLYGVHGRIVSERPLNPVNQPDPWEKSAIQRFRSGGKETFEVADLSGKPHMRLMRPLTMDKDCLGCHELAEGGIELIHAGIGVAVPMEEFLAPARASAWTHAESHGAIWLLGLAGIVYARRRVQRQLDERLRHLAETELSARVFDNGLEAIAITDHDGHILRVNPMFSELTGYPAHELKGNHIGLIESPEQGPDFYHQLWRELREQGRWAGETWRRRKQGNSFPAWESISTVADEHGKPRCHIFMFQDISERKLFTTHLNQIAHYDSLTQLPNRHLLTDRVAHALQRATRNASKLALLFIDLDQFKKINDTMGHQAGDRLLVVVAKRLSECVRTCDTLARLGGDEFALLLEDINDSADAERVALKILDTLAEPATIDERVWYLGASIGISLSPRDGTDMNTLLQCADTAMYRAKAEGRNRFSFFNEEMATQAALLLARETALRLAVEKRAFVLHYQPQFDLAAGRVTGVEALIRWCHGDEVIPPSDFIPLAEESGLIIHIGRWVLDTACREIAALHAAGLPRLKVAVNISALQLKQPEFVEHVLMALAESGLSSQYLELELTESTMMEDVKRTTAVLDTLAALGVSLSIDDFGTGYSSLAYLKQLPVHFLKVDRSFVRDVPTDHEDSAIVRTIITMSATLGLSVIAEGVETEAQLDFLRDEGCDLIQGYHISRPLGMDQLRLWLGARADPPVASLDSSDSTG